jgi:hypothetical protein
MAQINRSSLPAIDYCEPDCGASPVRAGAGFGSCDCRDGDGVIRIGAGAVRAGAWPDWRAAVAGAGAGAGVSAGAVGGACGASFCCSSWRRRATLF